MSILPNLDWWKLYRAARKSVHQSATQATQYFSEHAGTQLTVNVNEWPYTRAGRQAEQGIHMSYSHVVVYV